MRDKLTMVGLIIILAVASFAFSKVIILQSSKIALVGMSLLGIK